LQEPFSPQIRNNRDRLIAEGLQQLEEVFAPELDRLPSSRRTASVHALQVATSWATWESLRTEIHLSVSAARAAVLALIESLLPAH
jgi:hypothetical protein